MSDNLSQLAMTALAERSEAAALGEFERQLERDPCDVLALHWSALLHRALDRRDLAIDLLDRAVRLQPGNASLAHGLSQISLEAGRPAVAQFQRALALAPDRLDIRQGLTAARFASGDGKAALDDLRDFLDRQPDWLDGHRQHAQLAALLGMPERALESVERAIARNGGSGVHHLLAIELQLRAEDYLEVLELVERGKRSIGDVPALRFNRAVALSELGELPEASALFAGLGPPRDSGHGVRLLRQRIRCREFGLALSELEAWLTHADAAEFWPYAELLWRIAGDPRAEWLASGGNLVKVIDLAAVEIDLAGLAELLRNLHAKSGRFLDQSVRLGTQTDGALLARIEPEVVQLRESLRRHVSEHIASLPAVDQKHPTLGRRRDRPIRFAGSWSVRLCDAGHHASHHHPQGWISSAFYVAVPDQLDGQEGTLVLGEPPPDLGISWEPDLKVKPRPGRLVLFPSHLWHATRPFTAGERMTVAFDVATP